MKKLLLSLFAAFAMVSAYAQETVVIDMAEATDFVGTYVEEKPATESSNGEAAKYQPLESLKVGDYTFTLAKGEGSTDPAYYYPMSTNENGKPNLRVYKNNVMTLTAPEGAVISDITATGTKTSGVKAACEGLGTNVIVFTNTTGENVRFETITLTIGGEVVPPVDIANTPETAYTAAKAHELIDAGEGLETAVYVKGFITEIKEVSVQYGNATYYINDAAGVTEGQLMVYRGYYLDGEKFTAEDQIKVGDEVIVYGKLVNYNNTTHEFTTGSKIYSLNGTTGIASVEESRNVNAPVYNLAGQRVNGNAKGLLIVNGKKVIK